MLCSKLHCIRVFQLKIFSYKISLGGDLWRDVRADATLLRPEWVHLLSVTGVSKSAMNETVCFSVCILSNTSTYWRSRALLSMKR